MPPRVWKGDKKLRLLRFTRNDSAKSFSDLLLTGLATRFYVRWKASSKLTITSLILFSIYLLYFPSRTFSEELIVAAASDLTFAFNEIGKNFESETGNQVIFSFGSTGMLAEQIRHGAPFDIFAAADDRSIMSLKNENLLINDSIRHYAAGKLVIAYNKNTKLITSLEDLQLKEIKNITIANPDHAPYGIAAKEALVKAGLWNKLKQKIIFGENVRQALQFIQTGNVEAGIIAMSIAGVREINYVLIDEKLYPPINQTMAILKNTPKQKVARKFIDFICSKKGKTILEKFGYKTE